MVFRSGLMCGPGRLEYEPLQSIDARRMSEYIRMAERKLDKRLLHVGEAQLGCAIKEKRLMHGVIVRAPLERDSLANVEFKEYVVFRRGRCRRIDSIMLFPGAEHCKTAHPLDNFKQPQLRIREYPLRNVTLFRIRMYICLYKGLYVEVDYFLRDVMLPAPFSGKSNVVFVHSTRMLNCQDREIDTLVEKSMAHDLAVNAA